MVDLYVDGLSCSRTELSQISGYGSEFTSLDVSSNHDNMLQADKYIYMMTVFIAVLSISLLLPLLEDSHLITVHMLVSPDLISVI